MAGELKNLTSVQKCEHNHFLYPLCKSPSYSTGKKVTTIALLLLLNLVTLGVPLIIYGIYKAGSYLYNVCTKKDNTGAIRNQITSQTGAIRNQITSQTGAIHNQITSQAAKKLEADVKAALAKDDFKEVSKLLPQPFIPSPEYDPILKLIIGKCEADPDINSYSRDFIEKIALLFYDKNTKDNYLKQIAEKKIENKISFELIQLVKNIENKQIKDELLEKIIAKCKIPNDWNFDWNYAVEAAINLSISENKNNHLKTLLANKSAAKLNGFDAMAFLEGVKELSDTETKDTFLKQFIGKIEPQDHTVFYSEWTIQAAGELSDKQLLLTIIAHASSFSNIHNAKNIIIGIKKLSCSEDEKIAYFKALITGYVNHDLFSDAIEVAKSIDDLETKEALLISIKDQAIQKQNLAEAENAITELRDRTQINEFYNELISKAVEFKKYHQAYRFTDRNPSNAKFELKPLEFKKELIQGLIEEKPLFPHTRRQFFAAVHEAKKISDLPTKHELLKFAAEQAIEASLEGEIEYWKDATSAAEELPKEQKAELNAKIEKGKKTVKEKADKLKAALEKADK